MLIPRPFDGGLVLDNLSNDNSKFAWIEAFAVGNADCWLYPDLCFTVLAANMDMPGFARIAFV